MPGPVVVAVAGSEPAGFWDALRTLLPQGHEVDLLHVVDEAPRRELELQLLRRPGHRPPNLDERTAEAERRGSETILAEAGERLARGARAVVRAGRPEREIVALALELGAALVVLAARPRPGPTPPGPPSVGHVARFVLDHAPCPVLLVRLPPPGAPGRTR